MRALLLSVVAAINPRLPQVIYSSHSMGKPVMVASPIEVQTVFTALHDISYEE